MRNQYPDSNITTDRLQQHGLLNMNPYSTTTLILSTVVVTITGTTELAEGQHAANPLRVEVLFISNNTTSAGTHRLKRQAQGYWIYGCAVGGAIGGWFGPAGVAVGCGLGASYAQSMYTDHYGGRRKRQGCYYGGRRKRNIPECNIIAFAFSESDRDRNQLLDFSELSITEGANETLAQESFRKRDLNGNGYLDPDEVHLCLTNTSLPTQSRRVKRCSSYPTYPTYTSTYVVYI